MLSPIIDIKELFEIYKNENVLIFDVSNHKEAKANYEIRHLDKAVFVDLNKQLANINANIAIGGRHPLPKIEDFQQTLADLGISKDKHIILYDDKSGANAAARFWWMLQATGHQNVQVLNGGFLAAEKTNFPINSKKVSIHKTKKYDSLDWETQTVDINFVEQESNNTTSLIVDVRDRERFEGKHEPLDLIAGHIPNAINIPFSSNLDENGYFLEKETIKSKYQEIFKNYNQDSIIFHGIILKNGW